MTIVVLHYTLMITGLIRKAEKCGAITRHEAGYLIRMAQDSFPAASTTALVTNKGAPDFPYAALYFSTMIWQSSEAAEDDVKAAAGYKLAQFVLSKESPAHDSYWAAKLLRELYNAHEESMQDMVDHVA
jgi:hypothetical protein